MHYILIFAIITTVQSKFCIYHQQTIYGYVDDVMLRIPVKTVQSWRNFRKYKHKCKNPPSSKYLPTRPGTIYSNKFRYVILHRGLFTMSYKPSFEIATPFISSQFEYYVYGIYETTMNLTVKTITRIPFFFNDNYHGYYDYDYRIGCLEKIKFFCKRHGYGIFYRESYKIVPLEMGWSKVELRNISYSKRTRLFMTKNHKAYHAPFIPFYTKVPKICSIMEKSISKFMDRIDSVHVNMTFTYGGKVGLKKILKCFRGLINLRAHNTLRINGNITSDNTIASIKATGNPYSVLMFYKMLYNRNKSRACIEYTCIWYKLSQSSSLSNLTQAKANINFSATYTPTYTRTLIKNTSVKVHTNTISKTLSHRVLKKNKPKSHTITRTKRYTRSITRHPITSTRTLTKIQEKNTSFSYHYPHLDNNKCTRNIEFALKKVDYITHIQVEFSYPVLYQSDVNEKQKCVLLPLFQYSRHIHVFIPLKRQFGLIMFKNRYFAKTYLTLKQPDCYQRISKVCFSPKRLPILFKHIIPIDYYIYFLTLGITFLSVLSFIYLCYYQIYIPRKELLDHNLKEQIEMSAYPIKSEITKSNLEIKSENSPKKTKIKTFKTKDNEKILREIDEFLL